MIPPSNLGKDLGICAHKLKADAILLNPDRIRYGFSVFWDTGWVAQAFGILVISG
ncbi:MAG: hypothetical protein Fur0025_15230 [Oscillatoriaceae cyanobacterium]